MVPEKTPTTKKKTPKSSTAKQSAKTAKEKMPEPTPAPEMGKENIESGEGHVENVVSPEVQAKPVAPFKEGDDYTFMVRYDKNLRLFVGEVAEVSECKTKGLTRDEVLKELKIKLEDYLEDHRHQGGVPEPIFSKTYPEELTLKLSHSVFRKLDLLSRMEKISLDQLAKELLASAAEKRFESGKGGGHKHSQQGGSQQPRHSHHGGRHGGGHNRNRHNQGNLDSRENFMEYVRNLEKGGNRWKK
jgi:predicted HicB family RNase H-like nuclease